jgi:hypothetical protein
MAQMTLAELYKVEKSDPYRAIVLHNMIRDADALNFIPFKNVSSLKVSGLRYRNLPSVDFRAVGEGYTASHGALEEVYDSLVALGGDINFDRVFDLVGDTVVDPIKVQTDMKTKAMAFKFNDKLINGDPASEPKEFMGLKARISNMPSRQKVGFAGSSATGLDATASAANAQAFFQTLRKMSKRTNGGEHDIWLCNEDTQLGIGVVATYINASGGNFLSVTKDVLGREFPTLYGSPVVDIGLKKDQSTEIITDTETAGDSGSDSTSIYCVAFNEEQGLMGVQLEEFKVYDPLNGGEQESTPSKLRRIDWWMGFVSFGSYGITRGWNLHAPDSWTVPV